MDSGEPDAKPIAKPRRRWRTGLLLFVLFAVVWVIASRMIFRFPELYPMELPEIAPATETSFEGRLRIGTYNIAHGRGSGSGFWTNFRGSKEERATRLQQIADLVDRYQLDLLVLNEVDFDATSSRGVNQARTIAAMAGLRYCLEQHNYDANYLGFNFRAGNAVLSRYPLREPKLIRYPNRRPLQKMLLGDKRGVICDVLLPGDRKVRLVAVHIDPDQEEVRAESTRVLAELVAESREPVILAGDFNCAPGTNGATTALDILLNTHRFKNDSDDWPGGTWPSDKPDRVLDWVLVPRDWSFKTVKTPDSTLSDHRPVFVEIEWNSSKQ